MSFISSTIRCWQDDINVLVVDYDYDYNIDAMGNRTNVLNAGSELLSYTSNALNQYSLIDPATGTAQSATNSKRLANAKLKYSASTEEAIKLFREYADCVKKNNP